MKTLAFEPYLLCAQHLQVHMVTMRMAIVRYHAAKEYIVISQKRISLFLNRFPAKSLFLLSAIVLAGCSTNAKGIHNALEKHLDDTACTQIDEPLSMMEPSLPKEIKVVPYERYVRIYKNQHDVFSKFLTEENSKAIKRMQYLAKAGLFAVSTKTVDHKVYSWNYFEGPTEQPEKIMFFKPTGYGLRFLSGQGSLANITVNHRALVKVNHYTTPRVNSFIGLKTSNVSYNWNCSVPPKWATTKTFQHLFDVHTSNYAQQHRSQTTLVKKADGWTD